MTAMGSGLSQAWVFGHRLLPREAFTLQRRFLLSLRKATSSTVLAKLWAEAAAGVDAGITQLPPDVSVVRIEPIGPFELVVVRLPPPVGSGSRYVGMVFSQLDGRFVDEVQEGTAVYTWLISGQGASLRFIGAAGFVPVRPATPSSLATGGTLGFFDDPSLEAFVHAVKAQYAQPSAVSGFLERVRGFFGRPAARETHAKAAPNTTHDARWRSKLFKLSLGVMAVSALFGVPVLVDGVDGRFPATVTCAQLTDRRSRVEHEGRYVMLSGCEFSPEDLKGFAQLRLGARPDGTVSELELPLYPNNRTRKTEPLVTVVIRQLDLVGPLSAANRWQHSKTLTMDPRALLDGTYVEPEPPPGLIESVTDARRTLGNELAVGMGGVLSSGRLVRGPPPPLGFGYVLLFAFGGVFALLARLAPRRRLSGPSAVFAAFERPL
jgi:hypothetical protein